ncbi:shikimate dehydrogenase [Jeotgalibaca sp. MA1X17-3]|uniref:shikimate dehydrogenase n=1 Tax=Jeotgalibaca sp. MA1X17-3 TaxID=2908211 RepID=UPI001F2BC030|nr:shikimate dehydrogenase [Jeotgalibaca sp. MA1X17-3]UJF16033.1 shikimate dehydrogenase [Jeotgalibaca sp. MA1X17-3]
MNFYGLLGETLGHSFSPRLHKLIYQKTKVDAAYKLFPFPPKELQQAMDGIRTLSIEGVNVTIPYKEAVLPYLDEVDSFAKKLGAVNTIKNINGKLIGYNTDYNGFGLILNRRNWDVNGKVAVILGSGGAAKTVEAYLVDHGIRQIYIVTRSPERFEHTENKTYVNYEEVQSLCGDYLINTTPIGMYPDCKSTPVNEKTIQNFDYIIDLIYNPTETALLKLGSKNSKQTANGLDMLVGQAVRAVEIWQESSIDEEIIEQLIFEWGEQQEDSL